MLIKVLDINDNAPHFDQDEYEVSVNELLPIGSVVFRGLKALDADSGQNALVEYFTVRGESSLVSYKKIFKAFKINIIFF